MKCSSCGKAVPDKSVFCMFCGHQLVAVQQASEQLFNNQPPTMLACALDFAPEMEQAGKDKIARRMIVYLQLIDQDGQQTTFNGLLHYKIKWTQGYSQIVGGFQRSYTNAKGNIEDQVKVFSDEFYKSKTNSIWYSHLHAKQVIISSYDVIITAKIEIWFVPVGNNKTLYMVDTFYLRPTQNG